MTTRMISQSFFWLCFVLCMLFTTPLQAADSTPRSTIEAALNEALTLLKDPAYANPSTRPPLREKLETIIHSVFAFSEFSSRTVGKNWASFTPEQKQAFDTAFSELLMATYIDRIGGYSGEVVQYLNERFSSKRDRAELSTVVVMQNGTKTPVNYRMLVKDGRWWVYDVLVENVSLIKNYRSQFSDVLLKGSPDDLIARVKESTEKVLAGSKESQ